MENKRKYELSFANILCCMAVIFIHVNSEAVLSLDKTSAWYAAIYILWQAASFVVYGFIFLSGIKQFLNKGSRFNAAVFFKKRLISIVLPYVLWVAVYYAYDCFTHIEIFSLKNILYYLYSGDYIGHFYFIIIIVQFYLLMPFWVKLFKKVDSSLMIPFALLASIVFGQYLPNIIDVFVPGYYFRFADRTFTTYLFYWTAGAYIGMNYEKAVCIFTENKRFIYTVFAAVSAFALPVTLYNSIFAKGYTWLESIMTLYRICAVSFIFTLSLGKANKICRYKFFKYLDASSYNIYLCHCLVIKIVNKFFEDFGITGIKERYIVRFFAVYIISIGLCMLYTIIKKRITQHTPRL